VSWVRGLAFTPIFKQFIPIACQRAAGAVAHGLPDKAAGSAPFVQNIIAKPRNA